LPCPALWLVQEEEGVGDGRHFELLPTVKTRVDRDGDDGRRATRVGTSTRSPAHTSKARANMRMKGRYDGFVVIPAPLAVRQAGPPLSSAPWCRRLEVQHANPANASSGKYVRVSAST
jgi:hypothetical protein